MTPAEHEHQVGDVVRHRTGGERGVVTEVLTGCDNPEHRGPVGCLAAKFRGCQPVVTRYRVSVGLGRVVEAVPEEIEGVPPEERP